MMGTTDGHPHLLFVRRSQPSGYEGLFGVQRPFPAGLPGLW